MIDLGRLFAIFWFSNCAHVVLQYMSSRDILLVSMWNLLVSNIKFLCLSNYYWYVVLNFFFKNVVSTRGKNDQMKSFFIFITQIFGFAYLDLSWKTNLIAHLWSLWLKSVQNSTWTGPKILIESKSFRTWEETNL